MKKIAILFTALLFTFLNVSFTYAASVTPQMFHGNDPKPMDTPQTAYVNYISPDSTEKGMPIITCNSSRLPYADIQYNRLEGCDKDPIQPTKEAVQPTKACHISKCNDSCVINQKKDKPVIKPTDPFCIFNVILFGILLIFLLIIIILLFLLYARIRKFKWEGSKGSDKSFGTDVHIDKNADVNIGHNVEKNIEKNVENNIIKNKENGDNCHKNR